MEKLFDDLLLFIFEKVSDNRDRKSCSEVCKVWYTTEALTRVRVRVQDPEEIPNFLHRFSNLTTLEVDTVISDKTLVFVSRTFPKLQTLNLNVNLFRRASDPSVVDFGDEGLSAVAMGCRDLREVALSRRRNVRDGGIVDLQRKAQNLTALDLSCCTWVTDTSLAAAACMGSLSRLNVSFCPQVTDCGLDFLSGGLASRTLRVLDVSYCIRITDAGICGLKRLSFLEELNLCCCNPAYLTDAAGIAVASISSLQKLDLSMHIHFTDNILVAAASSLGLLSELYIGKCQSVTNHGLDLLSSRPAARCLRVLDISFCKQITDVGVCGLKQLPCLEELNLCCCGDGELTDVAGFAVASISSLRKLDLSRQNRITNATLFAVANNCRYLVEIDLHDCVRAMDKGLLYLASRSPLETIHMPRLGSLDQCTAPYFLKMVEQCPSLRLLKVDYRIRKRLSPSQLETLSAMCKLVWV